jgi:hypothetical protein
MKKQIASLCIILVVSAGFAQGLVNFYNTPTTLVSYQAPGTPLIQGPPGAYYFGLLIYPNGFGGDLIFSGVYGTNTGTPGMFNGGAGVAVPGWAAGETLAYDVYGWSANMGHDWNPQWLTGFLPPNAFFGGSGAGTGVAGGTSSNGTFPTLDLFGGDNAAGGFRLSGTAVPEPSTAALIVIGAGVLVCCSRSWRGKVS